MLIPNRISNWITLCAEKFDTACIYHSLLMNWADFWADYVLCCRNAIKPWFLTGELIIQRLTWLCSIMQLQFPAYVRETIILERNVYCYFRRMGHGAWWTYVQQVTTILPFLIVQGGDEEMGEIFPAAKRSRPIGSCWSRISTFLCIWHNKTCLCRSANKTKTPSFLCFLFSMAIKHTFLLMVWQLWNSAVIPIQTLSRVKPRKWKCCCPCKIHSLHINW